MLKKSIIICAGGKGTRMLSELPKQFMLISKNKCVLQETITKFYNFDKSSQIIVALPKNWISYWKNYCNKNNFNISHLVVEGGKERYHSIKNALKFCTGDYIAVHDAVRPLLNNILLENCFKDIENKKVVIPILNLKDSLRKLKNGNSVSVKRDNYVLVQTPQVFERKVLIEAYNQKFTKSVTDDASLVEKLGLKVHFCEGDEKNIKITTPFDLEYASYIYNKEKKSYSNAKSS